MKPASRSRFPALLFFGLLACAAACLAISSQSLWEDEAETAGLVNAPTIQGWWQAMCNDHTSNMMAPAYMLYEWVWARLCGVSEMALRASNALWFFVGLFAIAHFLRRRPGLRNATLLVYCIHPFVWYYLNEARPYSMQLGATLLLTGPLIEALDEPRKPLTASWWWLFAAGVALSCGCNLLGIPWVMMVGLMLLFGRPDVLQSLRRSGLPAVALCAPVLVILAVYYAWTLKEGAAPMVHAFSFLSVPFVFYEHLGFVGLGPGRVDMRSGGAHIFLEYLPTLCILGLPLIYALGSAALVRFGLSLRTFAALCLVVALPLAFVFALGVTRHFRVLGRHLTPLLPFVLIAVGVAIHRLWMRRTVFGRAVASLVVVALAASALECRFAYRHQRDDNRDAAAMANAALAKGEIVWWAAGASPAQYYNLPVSMTAQPGSALRLWSPTQDYLDSQKLPDLIFYSKPDLFDARAGMSDFIAEHGYVQVGALPAFTIWRAHKA